MNNRTNHAGFKAAALFALLVAAGVTARVAFQHIPNFAPVAALALFAGYFFRSRALAAGVPLLVMLISDRLIDAGGYSWLLMMTVYGLLTLPVLCRPWLKAWTQFDSGRFSRLAGSFLAVGGFSLACSLAFFFGTNAMVWATTSLYPQTMAGMASCFAAAIPFFRYTLAGDMAFCGILFGSYAAWQLFVTSRSHQLATTNP